MLKCAKPIDELKTADHSVQIALYNFTLYFNAANELHGDIIDRFGSPVLCAALVALIEHVKAYTTNEKCFRVHGYTSDDAFAWFKYESREVSDNE